MLGCTVLTNQRGREPPMLHAVCRPRAVCFIGKLAPPLSSGNTSGTLGARAETRMSTRERGRGRRKNTLVSPLNPGDRRVLARRHV